jgi:CheY-like chemotaxis protein
MNDPPRILVIDDDEMLLVLVRHFLSEEGYDLLSTADGPRGIQIYMDRRPDVVLLDLALPSMNGLEVLKRIREFDDHARVIVVTGYSSSESTEIAFGSGARDLLVKPFEKLQLIEAVKDALMD